MYAASALTGLTTHYVCGSWNGLKRGQATPKPCPTLHPGTRLPQRHGRSIRCRRAAATRLIWLPQAPAGGLRRRRRPLRRLRRPLWVSAP